MDLAGLATLLTPEGWALLEALPPYDESTAIRLGEHLREQGHDPVDRGRRADPVPAAPARRGQVRGVRRRDAVHPRRAGAGDPAGGRRPARAAVRQRRDRAGARPGLRHRLGRDGLRELRARGGRRRPGRPDGGRRDGQPAALAGRRRPGRRRHDDGPGRARRVRRRAPASGSTRAAVRRVARPRPVRPGGSATPRRSRRRGRSCARSRRGCRRPASSCRRASPTAPAGRSRRGIGRGAMGLGRWRGRRVLRSGGARWPGRASPGRPWSSGADGAAELREHRVDAAGRGSESPRRARSRAGGWLHEPTPPWSRPAWCRSWPPSSAATGWPRVRPTWSPAGAATTPFARSYAIEDVLPFQLKSLRAYLRERGVGRLTIKKRGVAVEPDQLRRQLRPTGDDEATIAITRVGTQQTVLVLRPARPVTAAVRRGSAAVDGDPGGGRREHELLAHRQALGRDVPAQLRGASRSRGPTSVWWATQVTTTVSSRDRREPLDAVDVVDRRGRPTCRATG